MREERPLSVAVFAGCCTLCVLGLLLTLAFLAFNIKYKHVRLIKMTSPNINIIISLGGLLSYVSCLFFGLDALANDNDHIATVSCRARTWLLSLAFTSVFVSVVCKSWRVNKIFRNAGVKRVVIKDDRLFLVIAVAVVLDIFFLGLWQGVDPLYSTKTYILPLTPISKFPGDYFRVLVLRTCYSRHSPIWTSVLLIYKGSILIFGAYLSWTTKTVSLPMMKDSASIIVSILFTLVCVLAITSSAAILREWPNVAYACVVGGLWICTTTVECLLFIPKVKLWWTRSEEDKASLSVTSPSLYSPKSNLEQVEEEMYHLLSENKALKRSLGEKESTIKALQTKVNSAKEKLNQFVEGEGKQDSGLDVDMSSSGTPDDDTAPQGVGEEESPTNGAPRISYVKRSNSICSFDSTHVRKVVKRRRSFNSRGSLRSIGSWGSSQSWQSWNYNLERLGKIKKSIKQDLDYADNLSTHLRDDISRDLNTCRDLNGSRAKRASSLAGSIASSYDLGTDSDTHSYISNYLYYPVRPKQSDYTSEGEISIDMARKCNDNFSTLANDSMYPSPMVIRKGKRRRGRRTGRKGQWKREPRPKVFTIQEPTQPEINQSAVAFKRNLNHTFV